MVNKVIKPKICKEILSKKKEISLRKSSCSTKKVKINMQVDISTNSEVAIDVAVKFRNNKKVSTWSEATFECPNPDCDLTVGRYRTLFDHFADKCKYSGFENFQWWCQTCQIPRYWVGGSDLVRHMQVYHGLADSNWPKNGKFPSRFLSFRSVTESFDPMDLLEHNKQFFGNKKHSDLWEQEVRQFKKSVDGIHSIVYERPDRGCESERKREAGGRSYGTKPRPSRSKKNKELILQTEIAKEMLEIVLENVIHPKPVKLLLCQIGNDSEWVSSRAAHLVGLNDIAHRDALIAKDAALKAKDFEIEYLMGLITDMRSAQSEKIKKVSLACDERVKQANDLALTQVPIFALSLVERQSLLMREFITTTHNGLVEAIDERKKDISTLKKLDSENFSQVMTSNIKVINID